MTTVDNLNLSEPPSQATTAESKRTISPLATVASRVPVRLWRYLLIGSDALLILLAFVTAYALRYQAQLFISVDPAFQLPLTGYMPLALPLVRLLQPSGGMSSPAPTSDEVSDSVTGAALGSATSTWASVSPLSQPFGSAMPKPVSYTHLTLPTSDLV